METKTKIFIKFSEDLILQGLNFTKKAKVRETKINPIKVSLS